MSTPFFNFFQNFNEIRPLESDFLQRLDSIALKPKKLFYYGKLPENVILNKKSPSKTLKTSGAESEPSFKKVKNQAFVEKSVRPKCVAVVGARKNTPYGEEVAYKLAYRLAKEGVIVISGLAFGIDSIAHQATLDAGGTTIAVLGTAIDQIYPRAHKKLASEIIQNSGAILSEYAPGTPMYNSRFLERNRLISGLSDAVIVVEAALKSGALNTAAHAIDQGRELFAVPGSIMNPLSVGTNELLKKGAAPCTSAEDILNFLYPERQKKRRKTPFLSADSKEELEILKTIQKGEHDGDKIVELSGLSVAIFNQTITLLEIKGRVKSLGANKWMLS